MPDYFIDSRKLLDAADVLAPKDAGPGRPAYTAHRRAVSTAYYAVFHAISSRVAEAAFATADSAFRQRVRRWIGHGDIRTVALWMRQLQGESGGNPPPHIRALLAPSGPPGHIDDKTLTIADGFLELSEKREQADYDHDAVFTRPDALWNIALARQVVAVIEGGQSDESKRFFGLIAMQAQIRARQ